MLANRRRQRVADDGRQPKNEGVAADIGREQRCREQEDVSLPEVPERPNQSNRSNTSFGRSQ
jgi:hypothetical protein